MSKPTKAPKTLQVDSDIHAKMKARAATAQVNLGAFASQALREWLASK